MPTIFIDERRQPFFRDRDGLLSFTRGDEAQSETITLDWSEKLGSSGSIALAVWEADGPVIANQVTTASTDTITFTGSGGALKCTVTTDGGLTYVQEIKVYESPTVSTSDY